MNSEKNDGAVELFEPWCDYCLWRFSDLVSMDVMTQEEAQTATYKYFRGEGLCPGCYVERVEQFEKGVWKLGH